MKTFLFNTTATMKPYNYTKWYIDTGIIRPVTIKAENINAALKEYQHIVSEKYYVNISNYAIKNKEPMYKDTPEGDAIQCGYVLTASTDFDNDHAGWVKQYIELWVNISIIINPFEGAAEK